MTLEKEEFSRRYTELLNAYVQSPDEKYLTDIEHLGQEMVLSDLPPEEIGEMHDHAFASLLENHSMKTKHLRAASLPLMQLLIAYGLVFREVRARHEIERALLESKQMYQSVVEQVSDGIAIVQEERHVYANPAAEKIWGKRAEDIVGRHYLDVMHPDEHTRLAEFYKQRMAGGGPQAPYETRCVNANGESRRVEMAGRLIQYQGKPADLVSVRDITERKQADEVVRKLSSAITHTGESVVITNGNGIIEYTNPAFTRITGYSAKEAVGKTPRILKSGNQDEAFYADMWKTITAGKVWQGKVIDRRKDGSFFPAMLTISPIFDESGEITHYTHFVGIQADLSRLEDMEHRFYQAQKMEAIGTMVGGIAHNFNNMLAGITGNLYLAKMKVQAQPDVVQKLANVEELSFSAARMIEQLLAFSRKSIVSMQEMSCAAFVREMLKMTHTALPENIALNQEICADSLLIRGDETQLHQVLMNLINNACDALEGVDHPRITIRLDAFYVDEALPDCKPGFKAGAYAHLSVADNGIGISEEHIEHLFEPFYTTKEQGKGTGLGLSMVYGTIKTHHGYIEVDSIKDRGSTFHIYIPLLEQKATVDVAVDTQEAVEGHGELILLVDDSPQIIGMGKEVLESLGYRVLTATDGQQAVEIFKAHPGEIDLFIFDVIMPVMSGNKAAKVIRSMDPHVKIIFSTGYDKILQAGIEHEAVLSKPFRIEEMSRMIRKELDS